MDLGGSVLDSAVMSLGSVKAKVATSQPPAAQAAVETLKKGGNAVDAALTASFMLDVVEPMSTGASVEWGMT